MKENIAERIFFYRVTYVYSKRFSRGVGSCYVKRARELNTIVEILDVEESIKHECGLKNITITNTMQMEVE